MADESEERGFTIVDKRGATPPGQPAPEAAKAAGSAARGGAESGESPKSPKSPKSPEAGAAGATAAAGESGVGASAGAGESPAGRAGAKAEAGAPPLPPVDFTSFALSLGTSALYHLGLVADPAAVDASARSEPNLPVARHTIDTLELLQQKTRGNLSEQEAALLANLLSELRLRFVEVESKRGPAR